MATAETAVDERTRSRRLVGVLALAVIGFAVQQTAIVPAVADVQTSLHAAPEWAAWLVTGYLTVATVATLAMGRLGDLHGRRRMLLLGMAVFALSSVGAAFASTIAVLLIFRALQGVGGAVYPLALSIVRDHVPENDVTVGIGALTGAFGLGTAVGFIGGGLLAEYVTWRLIFGLGAVLVALGGVAVFRAVPETAARATGRFDHVGTAILALAAVGLLAALTLVVPDGWGAPTTVGLLALAAVATVGWVYWERRIRDPLIDLHVLTEPRVLVANLATIGLGWALFSSFLLVPRLAQAPRTDGYGLGLGAAGVGAVLLPLAVGQLAAAPGASWLVRRIRTRYVFATGLLLVAAALGTLCAIRSDATALGGAVLLLGAGAGTALQAGSALATEGVSADVAAVSASVNSTVRRLAGGIGGQLSTILLASFVIAPQRPEFAAFVAAYVVAGMLCLVGAGGVLAGLQSAPA